MRFLSVLLFGWLAMTSSATAKPNKKQWAAAEVVLRDHFKAQNRGILEVSDAQLKTMGTAFWVRWEAGGGGLVIVRDKDVFSTKDMATISAWLKRDDFLKTRKVSADDFLFVLEQLGSLPQLESAPVKGDSVKALNPAWTFNKDGAVFTIFANRNEHLPGGGARAEPMRAVTRATLAVHKDYTLAAWFTEDTLVKRPRER